MREATRFTGGFPLRTLRKGKVKKIGGKGHKEELNFFVGLVVMQ
jgi:hypothetical protein